MANIEDFKTPAQFRESLEKAIEAIVSPYESEIERLTDEIQLKQLALGTALISASNAESHADHLQKLVIQAEQMLSHRADELGIDFKTWSQEAAIYLEDGDVTFDSDRRRYAIEESDDTAFMYVIRDLKTNRVVGRGDCKRALQEQVQRLYEADADSQGFSFEKYEDPETGEPLLRRIEARDVDSQPDLVAAAEDVCKTLEHETAHVTAMQMWRLREALDATSQKRGGPHDDLAESCKR